VGRREVRDLIAELHDAGKTIFFSTHILSDAEALCDRVAVLNKGHLRGVCVVADLLAQQRGNMEITWQSEREIEALKRSAEGYRVAGAAARGVFPEADTFKVISAIEAAGGRVISVSPVRASLEEYFLEKVQNHPAETVRA
jgi:ABC-2 type transport system ATP-binding protein